MATRDRAGMTDRARARGIRVAGIAIIILAAGAALLPAGKSISSDMIGGLLVASGLIEAVAGSLRREVRLLAMAAGWSHRARRAFVPAQSGDALLSNGYAGDRLAARPQRHPRDRQRRSRRDRCGSGPAFRRDGFPARRAADRGPFHLDAGDQHFRADAELVASFAWVLAASFAVNGLLLLEVASCAKQSADEGT